METYYGIVKTPGDAIILFEACRLGHLPRVQRRLSEKERQQIRSGSVFVWDEREAGMRRWTDGKSWSASRVAGSFLTYREMEGKRGGSSYSSPMVGTGGASAGKDRNGDTDMTDGPDGYRYKPDGLMKQSFSVTTSSGQHLHLISYHARSDPAVQHLQVPTQDVQLSRIRPEKGMYPESTMHDSPGVTRSPMTASPYGRSPRDHVSQQYLRHPPPGAGYAWPPSPMETPPAHYGQHTPYSHNMPPPGSTRGSPAYFNHQYNPQIRPAGTTAFDRPPPPMNHGPLPPPTPHGSQGYYQSSPATYPPPIPPQYSTALPPPSSIHPSAPSSSPYPYASSATYPPPNSYSHYGTTLPPLGGNNQALSQYSSSPYGPPAGHHSATQVDPRLNTSQDAQAGDRGSAKYDLPPPPPPPAAPAVPAAPVPNAASSSSTNGFQAKTIPSIVSLMNPASPPSQSVNATNGAQEPGATLAKRASVSAGNPAITASSSATYAQQLQNQSHHAGAGIEKKMALGEDSRLLRQLDQRAFAA